LLILAWSFAEKIHHGEVTPEQLVELPQCAQALESDSSQDYADNHSHLGGHGSHRKALLDFAFTPFVVDKKTANWPTLAEFSYLNTNQIDKNEQPRLLHALFSYLVNRTLFDTQTVLSDFADPFSRLNTCEGLKAQISLIDGDDPFATLLKLACCTRTSVDQSCLLLYTALFYAERYTMNTDESWRTGLRAFIHTSQLLRASMIHIGIGLGYFIEFFRFKTRKGKSEGGYGKYAFGSDMALNTFII
jgi:hypothetical protein